MLKKIGDKIPAIGDDCFIADSASVIGDVTVGESSTIFYGTVVRGDIAKITIGRRTNVQDNSVIHVSRGVDTVIGDGVTVGHSCILHGCTIGSNSLIGMGSTILDRAEIGENTIIGAGSLIPKGKRIPGGVMAYGSSAKVVRPLTEEELLQIRNAADNNYKNGKINQE